MFIFLNFIKIGSLVLRLCIVVLGLCVDMLNNISIRNVEMQIFDVNV